MTNNHYPQSYEIASSMENITSYDFVVRKDRIFDEALYAYCEGSDADYRINFATREYSYAYPIIVTPPTDTIYQVDYSPLNDIITGKFPIERISYTTPPLDPEMSYSVKLTTDDKNPHIPQTISINGELMEVVYGGNTEQVTEIEVPSWMTEDGNITISIDRKKGNPDRKAIVELYSYEGSNNVFVSQNTIKHFNEDMKSNTMLISNSSNGIPTLSYTISENTNVELSIYDISGRCINTLVNGMINKGTYSYDMRGLKSGTYFAILKTTEETQNLKFINIK